MILILILVALFVVLGVFLLNGKGSFLIAGFNAKSDEELKNYDTKAVCKFMGKIALALAFSMVFWVLGDAFDMLSLTIFGFMLFMTIMIFNLVYTYKWKRFQRQ